MRIALPVILFGFLFAAPTLASSPTSLGAASGSLYNVPEDPNAEPAKVQRVRIPIMLKAWNEVEAKNSDGSYKKGKIAGRPISQVLRARIERANDFYLGDWRIQTTPVRWLKRSNQYQVRLELFRRYGEAGQIEESLGSVTMTGVLEKQDDELYILNATARRIFRDKTGDPIVEIESGRHEETSSPAISRLER